MPETLNIDVAQIPQTTTDFQDLRHLLATYVRTTCAKTIVEIGTDVGDSARIFSGILQETQGVLYTIDLQPPKGNWLTTWPIKNIFFLQGDFKSMVWGQVVDLVFIDGDHSYEGCLADLQKFGPWVRVGGYVLLHDTLHSEFGPGIMKAIWGWTTETRYPLVHYPYQHGFAAIEITHELPRMPVVVAGGTRPG